MKDEHLIKLFENKDISFYELKGKSQKTLYRYIISTPQTRKICNCPEVVGCNYTNLLKEGVIAALKHFPHFKIKNLEEETISVIHFLRGGINFGLREALNEAFGFNRHLSSFMTSQRDQDAHGRWYIKDDQYKKIKIPKNANLFVGDVIATGTTIANGFNAIYNIAKNSGSPIERVFFFTIGSPKTEEILKEYDNKFREAFKGYKATYLFYIEGKFGLADSNTNLRIRIPGTDLLRHPCIVAPEFELSQYDNIAYPLERCTIYDAGSRSFDVEEHLHDVKGYWEKLRDLAENGFTLYDALKERWPEREYSSFENLIKAKKGVWKGIDKSFLKRLYSAYNKRWTKEFEQKSKTSSALIKLCDARIARIKSIANHTSKTKST